jgi:rhomboid protease GluP
MAVGFPPKYSEEINHVDLNEKQFMALALEAIKSLKWNVGRISKNKIIAYKSMSLASWGEEIIVDIEEHSATISSKCSSLQFIDWGRNRKNVEEFIEVCSPLAETISGNALTNKVQEMISSFIQIP